MDFFASILLTISLLAACAATAGMIAHRKRRRPTEGVLLGLILGPVGVAVETWLPEVDRPEVCEKAWNSFQTVAAYEPRSSRRARDTRKG